ncbi:MAG: type IIA DNA topoisomerase subunit B [Proteobacteria bacterium]|nr:type IIA DNA topoisomerase subunit B [Pseudomonadota bacterium]
MNDLFTPQTPFGSNFKKNKDNNTYTAQDIEVLEGLEPVRLRPGMYIGGTDTQALHHLVAEILDNSMDEVVGGFATEIRVHLYENGFISISDNGRGIPIDPHPKFKDKSALEVILTTLHSGGKFKEGAYEISGGLHGVGLSVVNALSDFLEVQVVREGHLYKQSYQRGIPQGPLVKEEGKQRGHGTKIIFHPDPEIFGEDAHFDPVFLYQRVRSKAFLHKGVQIFWSMEIKEKDLSLEEDEGQELKIYSQKNKIPKEERFFFPGGLSDFVNFYLKETSRVCNLLFSGEGALSHEKGHIEWSLSWSLEESDVSSEEKLSGLMSYCNTIPTPQGGVHEQGFKAGILKAFRSVAERMGFKKFSDVAPEDLFKSMKGILSIFIRNPQFQGQTKEKLVNSDLLRPLEILIKNQFEQWLLDHKEEAQNLLSYVEELMEERLSQKSQKELERKTATRRLRLPGKLADCRATGRKGTELFLVEGDSAGGSAKQARDRDTQAILPLRGKILNVANATLDKAEANQELMNLSLALGCGFGSHFKEKELRYDRIIIMTDADVDGAHIAALLMTFFFEKMPDLVTSGRLYLACPPLYRMVFGKDIFYAKDEKEKNAIIKRYEKKISKFEMSRFKGLGEMSAAQLKETTMDPRKRRLERVMLKESDSFLREFVNDLMGKEAEKRFSFIQENAQFAKNLAL